MPPRPTGYKSVRTVEELATGLRRGEEVYASAIVWRAAEAEGVVRWTGTEYVYESVSGPIVVLRDEGKQIPARGWRLS